jgi:hypothetical protein
MMDFLHRALSLIDESESLPPLFPFSPRDYVGLVCAIIGLFLAAATGMGGGGILVIFSNVAFVPSFMKQT